MRKLFLVLMLLSVTLTKAQEYFPVNTGVKTSKNTMVAFKNATIYMSSEKVLKKGTLLIKDGKVVSVGKSVKIPKGTKTIDLSGKIIYPSFIDIYSDFVIKKPKRDFSRGRRPQYDAERKGYYWNDHIRPETSSYSLFKFDSKKSKEYLKAGFGIVNTHSQDGIMRGSGMLVSLNPNSNNAYRILDDNLGYKIIKFKKEQVKCNKIFDYVKSNKSKFIKVNNSDDFKTILGIDKSYRKHDWAGVDIKKSRDNIDILLKNYHQIGNDINQHNIISCITRTASKNELSYWDKLKIMRGFDSIFN